MFEVPEWAECSVSSVTEFPVCLRRVTKMVTILVQEPTESRMESLGACNRHVEVIEMELSKRSPLPALTVKRSEFPEFMAEMTASVDLPL